MCCLEILQVAIPIRGGAAAVDEQVGTADEAAAKLLLSTILHLFTLLVILLPLAGRRLCQGYLHNGSTL